MRYHGDMKKSQEKHIETSPPLTLLGGISAEHFLAEYWQKKPLLIRGAVPQFSGLLSPDELAGLACEDEAQSRLISCKKGEWKLEHGPFDERRFTKLPATDWTLLVQGVNHHLPEGADLLQQFNFIPHARLDDLMVSYAPDGGGVGPHFDSYDVFLLQGMGRRLWRISEQKDLTLVDGAPLRILKHFDTEQEWVLDAGDMLYLPPHIAHWGIAEGDCMTYSIGFRAPSAQELGAEFLGFMQERIKLAGMYADPGLVRQSHPAEISEKMVEQVNEMLKALSWNHADVADFLGSYLSEPKPHIVFTPPRAISLINFSRKMRKDGLMLDLKSQLLFVGDSFYLNGEKLSVINRPSWLLELADVRKLTPELLEDLDDVAVQQLHDWYSSGYLQWLE